MSLPHRDTRAVSNVIGAILIVAIVVIGIATFGVFGFSGFDQTTENIGVKTAEQELGSIATAGSEVAFRGQSVKTIELELDSADNQGTAVVRPDEGQVAVVIEDTGGSDTTSLSQRSMGAVEYRVGETSVAYQGGGVWNKYQGQTAGIVRAGPIQSRNRDGTPTLTFPVLMVEGEGTIGSGATLKRIETSADPTNGRRYFSSSEQLRIEIDSKYAEAWARSMNRTLDNESISSVSVQDQGTRVVMTYGEGTDFYAHVNAYRIRVTPG